MRACPKCGQRIPSSERYCPYCGHMKNIPLPLDAYELGFIEILNTVWFINMRILRAVLVAVNTGILCLYTN